MTGGEEGVEEDTGSGGAVCERSGGAKKPT